MFFTIKELAELLGVSKTTINTKIKELNLEYDKKENNKFFFCEEKAVEIIKNINQQFDFSLFEKLKSSEKSQNNFTNSPQSSEKSQSLEEVQELKAKIAVLEEEKAWFRQQIDTQNEQINALTQNLYAAQQLAAADKKKVLELEDQLRKDQEEQEAAAAAVPAEEPTEEKKSFWQRLFGR